MYPEMPDLSDKIGRSRMDDEPRFRTGDPHYAARPPCLFSPKKNPTAELPGFAHHVRYFFVRRE